METKNKLITISLIVFTIFTIVMCKKDVKHTTSKSTQAKAEDFEKRMFAFTPKQIGATVKKFKEQVKIRKSTSSKSLSLPDISVDSLTVDSALWLIESSLNITFDRGGETDSVSTIVDTTACSDEYSPSSNGNICASDVIDIYDYYSDYCTGLIDPSYTTDYIKLVDIYTKSTSGGIKFGSNIVILAGRAAYPYVYNCNPFSSITAMWSISFTGSCASNTNDAPALLTDRLNCQNTNGVGCAGGGWLVWVDNVNLPFAGSATNSNLFYVSSPFTCLSTTLNDTQLNTYVTDIATMAASNPPPAWTGLPPGRSVGNYWIFAGVLPTNAPYKYFWQANVTYGRAICDTQFYQ